MVICNQIHLLKVTWCNGDMQLLESGLIVQTYQTYKADRVIYDVSYIYIFAKFKYCYNAFIRCKELICGIRRMELKVPFLSLFFACFLSFLFCFFGLFRLFFSFCFPGRSLFRRRAGPQGRCIILV